MTKVAIVDYGLCNLDSVRRAVEECGGEAVVTTDPRVIESAARVILPGVGAFPEAMANLERSGLADALQRVVLEGGKPFLGICLGMQLMASSGTEIRPTRGLGWVNADVRRLEPSTQARVPHIGWNELRVVRRTPLLAEIPAGSDFYFVHSFAVVPHDPAHVVAVTPFGTGSFVAAIQRDNMTGVQFHPEKSQRMGFAVLRNFLSDRATSVDA